MRNLRYTLKKRGGVRKGKERKSRSRSRSRSTSVSPNRYTRRARSRSPSYEKNDFSDWHWGPSVVAPIGASPLSSTSSEDLPPLCWDDRNPSRSRSPSISPSRSPSRSPSPRRKYTRRIHASPTHHPSKDRPLSPPLFTGEYDVVRPLPPLLVPGIVQSTAPSGQLDIRTFRTVEVPIGPGVPPPARTHPDSPPPELVNRAGRYLNWGIDVQEISDDDY